MTIDNESLLAEFSHIETSHPAYPHFPLPLIENLRSVQTGIRNDPLYLQRPDCKYPPRIRSFLEELFLSSEVNAGQVEAEVGEYFGEGDDDKTYDIIVRDAKRAYLSLSRLGTKMENSNKPEEQLNRVKTMAQLQERLLAIVEKAEGLRQLQQFKRCVLDIVDRVLTPDQRTQIMQQLEESLKA